MYCVRGATHVGYSLRSAFAQVFHAPGWVSSSCLKKSRAVRGRSSSHPRSVTPCRLSAGLAALPPPLSVHPFIATQVFGSQDPRHLYSTYVDPEGAYLSPKIQGKLMLELFLWDRSHARTVLS